MKIIVSLVGLLFFVNAYSQEYNPWSNQQISVAIQAEQMIEKVGFDKLMDVMFKDRYSRYADAEDKKQKVANRKALAALYGAGIDFSRKVWMITYSNENDAAFYDDEPSLAIIIPVKNKEVFKEAIAQLIKADQYSDLKPTMIEKGEDIYYFNDDTYYILNQKEFIVGPMKRYYHRYNYNEVEGIIIKSDTTAASKNIVWGTPQQAADPETPVMNEKPMIEVDRWDNGKITRVYTYKEKKRNYDDNRYSVTDTVAVSAPSKVVEGFAITPPASTEEIAVAAASPTEIKMDAKDYSTVSKIKNNTETRTFYLDDGRRVEVTYIPYTQNQRDSVQKARNAIRQDKMQKYASGIFENFQNLLIYNNSKDPDLNKVIESKEDIAILSSMFLGNFFLERSFLAYNLLNNSKPNVEELKSLAFINFENGKAKAKFQTGCCNEASSKINEMYLPITNFWPKEMATTPLAHFRYNLNIPSLVNYYKSFLPKEMYEEASNEMKKEGVEWDHFDKMFTGEMVMTVESVKTTKPYSKKERSEPQLIIGLKLKDSKFAVEFMNKMANKSDLESTQYYRFDEKGQYIYFNTQKISAALSKPTNQTTNTLNFGHFGEIKLDVKNMIISFASQDMKDEPVEFNLLKNFFNKVYSVNNKSEDGNFVSEIVIDLGNENKNALSNLVSLADEMEKANEARRRKNDMEYEKERKITEQKRITAPKPKTSTPKKPVKKS